MGLADLTKLQNLINDLLSSDPAELVIRRMEDNFSDASSGSGLGLLTIMNDYGGKIGWRFEEVADRPDSQLLTTTVKLSFVAHYA